MFLFVFYTDMECITIKKLSLMLKGKVIEFYVETDDFYIEFVKMIENRPKIEDFLIVSNL